MATRSVTTTTIALTRAPSEVCGAWTQTTIDSWMKFWIINTDALIAYAFLRMVVRCILRIPLDVKSSNSITIQTEGL